MSKAMAQNRRLYYENLGDKWGANIVHVVSTAFYTPDQLSIHRTPAPV